MSPPSAAPGSAATAGTAIERLALFGCELRWPAIPPTVVARAKLHLLDTLGCALAAAAPGEPTAVRAALEAMHGDGPATVVGGARRLPAPAAAAVNGTLANAADHDDTHLAGIVNVGAIIGPAALAAGELSGATGPELLTAIVAGSEALIRIGLACAPGFVPTAFHPAAVCGPYAAALAGAMLADLSAAQTANAMAIAGGMAAGTYEPVAQGRPSKALQVGWAAHSGLTACALAAHGLEGPLSALDGPGGLLRAFFGVDDDRPLQRELDDLGERWESLNVTLRGYPACYYVHAPLDAVRVALDGRRVAPERVREVRVAIPPDGIELVVEPRASRVRPATPYAARFSLQYGVAAMLVSGRVDAATYTWEAISAPRVLEVAERVVVRARRFVPEAGGYAGAVEIELDDGTRLAARVDHPVGTPQRPMSEQRVVDKFRANAGRTLDADGVVAVERAVAGLDRAVDLSELAAALATTATSRRRV